ncbi:MAG: hydroxyacid dehydrogenase [Flavobacteriales bacterium]|nr:hydroxyacid dehydrogenase [Flavobacteriales bacterium]
MKKIISVDLNHSSLNTSLQKKGFIVDEFHTQTKEEIENIISNYNGLIIRSRFPIDKQFLDKATNLEFIARVGAGMENIDCEYAKQKGIHLINSPEGNRDAVAEHCLGMLLSLMHRIFIANIEVKNNIWKREENRGDELMGKTIGIVGYGVMGKAFAKRLAGFSVNVIFVDILDNLEDEFAKQANLETIFSECDVVSLHLPQTEKTKHYVNSDFIHKMQKPFYLINSARGQCVNLADLVDGIKSNKVKGACLDVLEYEKSSFDFDFKNNEVMEFLCNSDKVILTPHVAGWSFQSNEKMAKIIVDKIDNLYTNIIKQTI